MVGLITGNKSTICRLRKAYLAGNQLCVVVVETETRQRLGVNKKSVLDRGETPRTARQAGGHRVRKLVSDLITRMSYLGMIPLILLVFAGSVAQATPLCQAACSRGKPEFE